MNWIAVFFTRLLIASLLAIAWHATLEFLFPGLHYLLRSGLIAIAIYGAFTFCHKARKYVRQREVQQE